MAGKEDHFLPHSWKDDKEWQDIMEKTDPRVLCGQIFAKKLTPPSSKELKIIARQRGSGMSVLDQWARKCSRDALLKTDTEIAFDPQTGVTRVRLRGGANLGAKTEGNFLLPDNKNVKGRSSLRQSCSFETSRPRPMVLFNDACKPCIFSTDSKTKGNSKGRLHPNFGAKSIRSLSEGGATLAQVLPNIVATSALLIPETGETISRILSESQGSSIGELSDIISAGDNAKNSPRFFHRSGKSQEKSSTDEVERSLCALVKLASNWECVPTMLDGLAGYMRSVLTVIDGLECPGIEKAVNELFNQIVQSCFEQLQKCSKNDEKHSTLLELSKLLNTALELLKGRQSLHFTALNTINKIIDMCIVYKNYELGSMTKSAECASPSLFDAQHSSPKRKNEGANTVVAPDDTSTTSSTTTTTAVHRITSLHKRRTSTAHEPHPEEEEGKATAVIVNRTPLEILTSLDPSHVIAVLHNNITMQKRNTGSRQKCTPSVRWRHCTHHCLQILSSRILTVMSHGAHVQKKMVSDGHIRTLVEALDPNHDPQLLCLLLQCLACIALTPGHHQALSDADISDMLMQLLLPSDEWYYTNHSTKYAKFVKYHAARILVYMGMLHKLGGRVDLFDRRPFKELPCNPLLQVHSPEDCFIELMAMGSIVVYNNDQHVQAASLEGLVAELIQEAMIEEQRGSQNPVIQLSGSVQSLYGPPPCDLDATSSRSSGRLLSSAWSPHSSLEFLNELHAVPFREYVLGALPILVHPVIVLRLLAHKLFGNMIRRKDLYSDAKLKPPKVDKADMYPPRKTDDSSDGGGGGGAADPSKDTLSKRRKTNLHVVISDPPEDGVPLAKSVSVGSQDRGDTGKSNNHVTNINGTTKAAIMMVADSLVTPLGGPIGPNKSNGDGGAGDVPDSGSEVKSNARRFIHWPSKKRMSKSQATMAAVVHQDSISSQISNMSDPNELSPCSTPDMDIVAFQRELINLPTFVMDTPPPTADVSPVFSRSSSVPDNLAHRLTPSPSQEGWVIGSHTPSSENGDNNSGKMVTQSVERMCDAASVVTITKTDADADECKSTTTSPMTTRSTHDAVPCSVAENTAANIIVHFEAPNSPQLSNSSQSPQHTFDYPSPPQSSFLYNNHLSPGDQSGGAHNYLFPSQPSPAVSFGSPAPSSSDHTPLLPPPAGGAACVLRSNTMSSSIAEMPSNHQGILKVIETWIHICRVDFDGTHILAVETKDFLKKLSNLGYEYKIWCQRMGSMLYLEDLEKTNSSLEVSDDAVNVHAQYKKLQQLVVSGALPASKEEAATLAGIQLHIEEAWPEEEFTDVHPSPADSPIDRVTEQSNQHAALQQENLKKKKELIRLNRAQRISSSRRKKTLIRSLLCGGGDNDEVEAAELCDLSAYLPPMYTASKQVRELIKEKKKKLWHTPYYENEVKLKQLYIKICKNLPTYGCKLFCVKEILRGNTQKKIPRLLGVNSEKIVLLDNKTKLLAKSQNLSSLEDWLSGSGRSHDGLLLEFRGTKPWLLTTPSPENLKSVTAAIWQALDVDGRFLNSGALRRDSLQFDFHQRPMSLQSSLEVPSVYTEELERLQKMLHFPEEVAFLLTDREHDLFTGVPPAQYVRQVTMDLSRAPANRTSTTSVEDLIQRFNEVSSWITQVIITQATHDDRKAVLSCILRLVVYCWVIGNFNSAVEILAGLRSEKLKPFWLSISEEDLSTLHSLCDALLTRDASPQYREAVSRALDIPQCKVVPFFGGFLRDLKAIFSGVPSIIVLPSTENQTLEFISDFNGEDRFMTRIGVGGLMNLDKLKQAHIILNDIHLFHHSAQQQRALMQKLEDMDQEEFRHCVKQDDEDSCDSDYDLDLDSYQPVRPIYSDHEVMVVTPKVAKLNHHWLQCMNHGTTVVRWDEDGGRSVMCYLKLEIDNVTLTWRKPPWSSLKNSVASPDFILRGEVAYTGSQILCSRYMTSEEICDNLEEGFLDISVIKEVTLGDEVVDLGSVCKRHGVEDLCHENNCVTVLYGSYLSENRKLWFIAPGNTASIWYHGLRRLVEGVHRLRLQTDKRLQWLKIQYLQLYYENERCTGPTPADAIKVFGGRSWTTGPQNPTTIQEPPSTFKRTPSFGVGFRKKMTCNVSPKQENKDRGTTPVRMISVNDTRASTKQRRTPSPLRKVKNEMQKTATSDPMLNHIPRGSPTPGFRPRSLTFSFTNRYRSRRRRMSLGCRTGDNRANSITHSSQLSFLDFVDLFKSFGLRCRKDLKDLFEQFAVTRALSAGPGNNSRVPKPPSYIPTEKDACVITRNNSLSLSQDNEQRHRICDAIAVASIISNCAGLETSQNKCMGLGEFRDFLADYQEEHLEQDEILELVRRHEPDATLRDQSCLSFEGFARYLMDKDNYANIYEKMKHSHEDMDHALPHYFIATSHNTYLTGHQLKGESSVDLYSQVLLMGCRCVELDCWDGDDGMPIIYHGHTLTTKISFKGVVDAINRSAFVTSPYPVILSIENHCSLPQQQKMAQIFTSVFGEKLITKFLFDSDFVEDPQLPSPNQLKYRILIKNKKLRDHDGSAAHKRLPTQSRTSSMASSESTSINDFDDDDDDDEDEDDVTDACSFQPVIHDWDTKGRAVKELRRSVDSQDSPLPEVDDKSKCHVHQRIDSFGDIVTARPQSGSFGTKQCPKSQPELDWHFDDDLQDIKVVPKIKPKKASQIAKELSDLVVYTQAVKFRGLSLSPNTSLKQKKGPVRKGVNSGTPTLSSTSDKNDLTPPLSIPRLKKYDGIPPCYLVSSLNENKAKQLCRRNQLGVINHTERQLMRTYPAGMRIDSSNFNPVIFWAFGIQMVALNYQTEDVAMALNTAMFEANGRSGYVLKPPVMYDKNHVMYNRFNPLDKEFDGLHATILTLHIISGQYVCLSHTASTQVEVEIIGIPVDCAKQKTKVVSKNSLNPIWNDVFTFQVLFSDLAFIRFVVTDSSTSHLVSQRIIPLHSLRPGYRHVRLRTPSNQPMELATLFVYSKHEEELLEPCNSMELSQSAGGGGGAKKISLFSKSRELSEVNGQNVTKLKRRMFFISVFGVTAPDEYIILKVTQDTTVYESIAQALIKVGHLEELVGNYVLVEDVQSGWEKKDQEKASTQRILDMGEKVLQAQNRWKGAGRFILRRVTDDPSSRAWMTTLLKDQKRNSKLDADAANNWDSTEHMFVVCVYNVSPDQPYTVFKAPVSSTAQDIITQAMMKARRANTQDPRDFVLVEELDSQNIPDSQSAPSKHKAGERTKMRILADDENVYQAQTEWKMSYRFVLASRDQAAIELSDEKLRGQTAKGTSSRPHGMLAKRIGSKKISKHSVLADRVPHLSRSPDTVRRSISFPSQVNNSTVVAAAKAASQQPISAQDKRGMFQLKKLPKLNFKMGK